MNSPGGNREKDRRLYGVGGLVLAGMWILLVGLWYVQVVTALNYVQDQETQSMRTVRIPAVRGSILDANGRPLAYDRPMYVVNAYLEELRHHFRQEWKRNRPKGTMTREDRGALEIAVRYLVLSNFTAKLNLDQPIDVTPRKMQAHFLEQRALPLPVINNLSETNTARFIENSWKVPGLEVEVVAKRSYPSLSVAHIVGHLKRDNSDQDESVRYNYRLPDYTGKLGLEKTFDGYLRGQPGVRSVLVNNLGYRQSDSIPVPPQPGSNVVLTLDLEIQEAAMKALNETEGKGAAAVVIDVNSGDVVAMASIPVFDPNQFTPGISHQLWNSYLAARPSPLIFRATQERYPPGSIFKIISGLAALEHGLNPTTQIYSAGYYRVGRRRIKDTAAPGHYDFKRAFKKSSNTYFIHHTLEEGRGIKPIINIGQQLFLGQRTGLLPGQEAKEQFPTMAQVNQGWSDGDTANIAIGQGPITVTPLQMALVTATVANGGTVYHPRLVDRIESPDPSLQPHALRFPKGKRRGQLIVRPENLAIIRDAMRADVADDDGTGKRARIEGYEVCGKTGTAEVRSPSEGRYKITWFTSFAPFENPRYAVVVMVERGVSGGRTCAPAARKIYEALIERDKKTGLARN